MKNIFLGKLARLSTGVNKGAPHTRERTARIVDERALARLYGADLSPTRLSARVTEGINGSDSVRQQSFPDVMYADARAGNDREQLNTVLFAHLKMLHKILRLLDVSHYLCSPAAQKGWERSVSLWAELLAKDPLSESHVRSMNYQTTSLSASFTSLTSCSSRAST